MTADCDAIVVGAGIAGAVAALELARAGRRVIVLAYAQDLSQAQIATRLEWPLGTVKSRTRRAMAQLRMRLGVVADDDEAPTPELREATGERLAGRDR